MGVKRFDYILGTGPEEGWIEEASLGQYVKSADYDALEAELAEHKAEHTTSDNANVLLHDRIAALESALREATWLLHEDVPGDPPVEEDEHYARKAAWNADLTRLGIPVDCYAAKTPVSTLCAVCEQIKELHPSTHPWTARTTPDTSLKSLVVNPPELPAETP